MRELKPTADGLPWKRVLAMSTLAFTTCFAVWGMNGVLVAFLAHHDVFPLTKMQIGWLLGLPIASGSLLRLPVGILTDRLGGGKVFPMVLLCAAVGSLLLSRAESFAEFAVASVLFGLAGTSFAVGAAYTSACAPRDRRGTALGIFGAGNVGAVLPNLGAPPLLDRLTHGGRDPDGWRAMPALVAAALVVLAGAFALLSRKYNVAAAGPSETSARALLPLHSPRVWRFICQYVVVFGLFVGIAQWLVLYYVRVYHVALSVAARLAAVFTFSSIVRAFGGWLCDRVGARAVMVCVLFACSAGTSPLLLTRLSLIPFTAIVVGVGLAMSIGKAAVYAQIARGYPNDVGTVGGLVSMFGGLGGFVTPLAFAYILGQSGAYESCWIVPAGLSAICLVWEQRAARARY
jgi:NNP family nitrate/nitrite transporter-like MFS transporter